MIRIEVYSDEDDSINFCVGAGCDSNEGQPMLLVVRIDGYADPMCYRCFLNEELGLEPEVALEILEELEG